MRARPGAGRGQSGLSMAKGPGQHPGANHEQEEEQSSCNREQAARPHDAEPEVFADRTNVLLGSVGLAPEPVRTAQRETDRKYHLPETEERELNRNEPLPFPADRRKPQRRGACLQSGKRQVRSLSGVLRLIDE